MSSPLWLALVLLAFAPSSTLGRPSESPQQQQPTSTQSFVKTLGQEIGSPSELAWQAWLLVESKGGMASALDSSNILRRITPKSIFIAPQLTSCPSGYSKDRRGTCRPDPIVLDEVAQKQFLLKRLNALYGKFGANKNKKPDAPPQGPLQINIPIGQSAKPNPEQTIPVLVSQQPVVVDNKTKQEAVAVVVYKVDNDTKKDNTNETSSFLLGSSNASVPPKQVAEIIVEASNDTFTEVVDYKMPLVKNSTSNKDSSEDSSPTVVLLLSQTKVPSTTTTTTEETTTETTTMPTTIVDETRFEPIQTVAPLDVDTTIVDTTTERVTMTSRDEYERRDQQMTTMTSAPSTTIDDETAYTEEDDETQTPEQDSTEEEEYEDEFTEDELLKPGEAGSMMSPKNQELIRSKTHHRTTIPVTMTTAMVQDTTTTIPTTDDVLEAKESTINAEFTTLQTTTTEVPSTIVVEETTTPRVTATIQIDAKPIPQRYVETRRPPPTTTTEGSTFFPQRRPSFSVNDEAPIFFKDRLPPEFKDQLPPRAHVRFPDSPTRQQNRGSYVRFPSDDVNSIHHDSLKDLSPFQYSSSTKSSVQRWRQQQQQKQKPMLLRFWARMPLVRDLSFYPTTSHGSHNEPIGGHTPPTVRRAIFKSDG